MLLQLHREMIKHNRIVVASIAICLIDLHDTVSDSILMTAISSLLNDFLEEIVCDDLLHS